jgi:hypothetical protein
MRAPAQTVLPESARLVKVTVIGERRDRRGIAMRLDGWRNERCH